MRTFEQTHPWLCFRWEPRRVPYPIWLLLGEAAAHIRLLGEAAVPQEAAQDMHHHAMYRGLLALASLEGNTLSEEQVERCLAGTLALPAAQAYLAQEIMNLSRAFRWTEDRLRAGDRQFSPWSLQLLNAQLLKGLPWDESASPGEYRSARRATGLQEGAPVEDIAYLIERLCDWLAPDRFMPEHEEEAMAFGAVRAILAQLYIVWIMPFAEGNVRTAGLVTGQMLLEVGTPLYVVQLFLAQMGRERAAWMRELASAGRGHGDPVPFIALLARILVDCLRGAAKAVEREQERALLNEHLHRALRVDGSANGSRRQKLLMALAGQGGPVSVGAVARLDPEIAAIYARLDRKTLLRDIRSLEEEHLLVRSGEGLALSSSPLRAFRPLVKR